MGVSTEVPHGPEKRTIMGARQMALGAGPQGSKSAQQRTCTAVLTAAVHNSQETDQPGWRQRTDDTMGLYSG